MLDKEVQKLRPGDFLTWVSDDDNSIAIGRILKISRYGKNADKTWHGHIEEATVLVFPVWSNDGRQYSNLTSMNAWALQQSTRSTQIEIDTWIKAAEAYINDRSKELELLKRIVHRPVIKSHVLPIESVHWDYRRNPPKQNCSWNWLWGMAKHFGLWKPSK